MSRVLDEQSQDFSKYGLSIKVSFRDNIELQALNSMVHSGGERAITTALYMLSLQDLTPVPFRCVDEINQGMDETNERLVYKLLFNISQNTDTSQYFIISPKVDCCYRICLRKDCLNLVVVAAQQYGVLGEHRGAHHIRQC